MRNTVRRSLEKLYVLRERAYELRGRAYELRGRAYELRERGADATATMIIKIHEWRTAEVSLLARLRDRRIAIGLGATMIVMAGLIAGTTALATVAGRSDAAGAASAGGVNADAASAALRQQAADRSNRSTRPAAPPKAAETHKKPPDWVTPMPGVGLSSCWGPRWGSFHEGIDFAGKPGTPILSIGSGTVFGAGWLYSGYGISVVIDHGNGYFSHYAHAAKVLVRPGQKVKPGQPIAIEGNTGDSAGPHLHFEIHHGLWNQINPAPWLKGHGVPVGC